ncbi:MAG: SpoIIE family protein phosphatase [Paracoccus sp. (in: a-proteobacteria)]|uniref:PP2C family protein-serine/threonine phosphatase n=1 Tax=Paracoccus sp. TaxID=267 RepID=UPI0026DFBD34|nr:SpoIIE family protein phosphatase [Paracoccus sp. (in: a-proteobacteria)]MDO5632764.1 SpoIIE family protein phosphatase [Paracoccus sp. (in: a-proteobacteria)]
MDDSRAQRRTLAIQLRRAGYEVVEAASAPEAMAICQARQPDMILSDWVMPGMSGPEFCQAFRAMKREGYGYFILLTSKTDKADIAYGLAAGADDFMTKPVAGAELLARLAAAERILRFEEQLRATNAQLLSAWEKLHAAQEAMDRDLIEARKLQQGLVRERNGSFGPFDLSLMLRPAGHIGGDLVGFFPIDADRAGIFAIDVSGHGVAAALLAARLAVHLSGSAEQNIALHNTPGGVNSVPPKRLARILNTMMLDEMQTDTYFTMLYAELNHRTGMVNLVQAGHPHPVLQRSSGEVVWLGNGGMPIGLFTEPRFDEVSVRLHPGDRLLITSDGITEAENPDGRLLGEEGMSMILRTNQMLHGHNFLESMSWSISEYTKGERGDDMSAVLIEYRATP